jgi:hypothetical protein
MGGQTMAAEEDLILNIIEKTTGNALREGADDLDHLGDRADHAGGAVQVFGREAGHADTEIVRLRGHIRELAGEFNRTGNTDLLKNIKSDKSQLRQFENIAKLLTPAGEEGGRAFNKGFLSTIGDLGANLRGAMIPAAIGLGVLLAPIIGGSIAGAVTGAVGLGGIAGGIFAAAQDTRVKQAAAHFGQSISSEFAEAGKSFVEPVIASLDILKRGFSNLNLDEVFARAAPFVTVFAQGISDLVTSAMPGINRAMAQLGPIMAIMAEELPQVGAAFGDMIGDMAESEGAVEGLHFVFEALVGAMRVTGSTVAWLSDRFHDMVGFAAASTGALEDIPLLGAAFAGMNDHLEEIAGTAPVIAAAWAPIPGRFQATAGAIDTTTTSSSNLTMSIQDLKSALDDLFDTQMSYDQAILAVRTDTLALRSAVDSHGTSLKNNSQAGLDNQRMILGLVRDYEQQRDASIKMGTSTAAATRKFDDQVGALGRMLSSLGFNKTEIDRLLGAYRKLHDAPNIQKEIRINVSTTGQTGALSLMGAGARVATFAEGGWVQGPPGKAQMAIVHGGEFVLSHDMLKGVAGPQRMSMPAAATSTQGPTTRPIVISGDPFLAAAFAAIQKKVRQDYGGDVVAAFG